LNSRQRPGPDRDLDRGTTAFRIVTVISIAIVLGTIGGYTSSGHGTGSATTVLAIGGTGLLFLPPLLMIVFRRSTPLVVRLESRAAARESRVE
jgi:hypothetical protein